jgi:hypothetical protein
MKNLTNITLLPLLLISGLLWAYEPKITHSDLSAKAVLKSALNTDANLLPNLGLLTFSQKQTFSSHTITTLFTDGAIKEDDDTRALNHFYDPYKDRPLTILFVPVGEKSPDWSLEDKGDIAEQLFSYKDAKDYFYKALTAVAASQHDKYQLVFNGLQPNLSTIVSQLGTLQQATLGNEMAEYLLVRNTTDGPQGFLIYFLLGEDGVWRIDGM